MEDGSDAALPEASLPTVDSSFSPTLTRVHGAGVDPVVTLPLDQDAVSSRVQDLTERGPSRRYDLKGEVARGGMGAILEVYDNDLRRRLAMKVILGQGRGSTQSTMGEAVSRFLEEAQVTGQLDHPGVVPVHELGVDAEGRVYFTMQLVRGRDLKHIFELVRSGEEGWTRTRALGVLLKVCEAMAYAHDKGVIHRDLKPANVMVGRYGEVYVMDWGLARVVGRDDSRDLHIPEVSLSEVVTDRKPGEESTPDSPLVTMDGTVVGTPYYMPPEQAAGRIEEMGPHSDVYALGAMLYQLLSGRMPYFEPEGRVSARTVLAMVIQGPPASLDEVARDAPAELVAICEKAMARDPEERYPSTVELKNDLQAFLENRVVHAYETGALAEFRKWTKRNRGMAASLAAAILVAIVGSGSTAYVEASANQRLEKSNEELAQARDASDRVADFLVDLFESPVPAISGGAVPTAEELLDWGAISIAEGLEREPLVRAKLMTAMGRAYVSLDVLPKAEPLLEQALRARRAHLSPDDPRILDTLAHLAALRRAQGRYDEAESLFRETVEGRRGALGAEAPDTLNARDGLALVHELQGRYEEAERIELDVLATRKRVLGEDHASNVTTLDNLASIYRSTQRLEEAEPLLERAIAISLVEFGADHPRTMLARNNLAGLYERMGRFEEAERHYVEVLELSRRLVGERHHFTAALESNLAMLLGQRGRFDEAIAYLERALETGRELFGDDHPSTLTTLNNLAGVRLEQGRPEDALPLFERALAGMRRSIGVEHPHTLSVLFQVTNIHLQAGRLEEALPFADEALAVSRVLRGDDDPHTLQSLANLAMLHYRLERPGDAEPLARELVARVPADHPDRATFEALLERILEALAKEEGS